MDNNYINELVEEYSQELTTEEFMELHCVSRQEVAEESLSEEEHHPNKAVAICTTNLFNDNAVSHFYKILKFIIHHLISLQIEFVYFLQIEFAFQVGSFRDRRKDEDVSCSLTMNIYNFL